MIIRFEAHVDGRVACSGDTYEEVKETAKAIAAEVGSSYTIERVEYVRANETMVFFSVCPNLPMYALARKQYGIVDDDPDNVRATLEFEKRVKENFPEDLSEISLKSQS